MKGICRFTDNQEGATSVLVIFMLIVLVTLGAFAITSARVNIKFAQSAIDWNARYYALDEGAEEYLARADMALAAAEAEAGGDWAAYMSVAYDNLAALSSEYADNFVLPYENGGVIDEIYVELNLAHPESEKHNLAVALSVTPPYDGGERYAVTEWRQWQTEAAEEATQELWQGIIIP